MLVLSRQRDEVIKIGDDIEVSVVDIRGDKVRLGISAPKEIPVHRKEVYEQKKREGSLGELAHMGSRPTPISEWHEDDGHVMVVRWDGDDLADFAIWHPLDTKFDIAEWTHFYKLPNIQPPEPNTKPAETKATPWKDGYVSGRGA